MEEVKKAFKNAGDQLAKGPSKAWNRLRRYKNDLVAQQKGEDEPVSPSFIVARIRVLRIDGTSSQSIC
jgi:hypothetical protein